MASARSPKCSTNRKNMNQVDSEKKFWIIVQKDTFRIRSTSQAGIRADDSRHTFLQSIRFRCRWRRRWPKPFRPVTNRWRLRRYLTVEHRTYRKSVCSWTPHWIIPWPQSSVSGFWSELYPRRMRNITPTKEKKKPNPPVDVADGRIVCSELMTFFQYVRWEAQRKSECYHCGESRK